MRLYLLCAHELNPLMLNIMFNWKIHGYNWNITLLFPNMGVLAGLGRTAASVLTLASPFSHLSCCSTVRAG